MRLSTQADYAVRAVYELACRPPGAVVQTRDLAAAQGLPEAYLAKVVQALVRAGILRTARGYQGGVALAVSADRLSVRDVFEAVDGPLLLHRCEQRLEPCAKQPCGTHDFWTKVEALLTSELERTSFAALASRSAQPATSSR